MKITCTKGAVTVYPQTGIITPGGIEVPLVANPTGESYVVDEGESYDVENIGQPAIGGKFWSGSSAFTVTNDSNDTATLIRWFEVDNNPIYADEMQAYLDLDGNRTDSNMMKMELAPGETYETDVVKSNALTVTILPAIVTIQPV